MSIPQSLRDDPLQVLAKTLYGEARGEGADGMLAVGCVIRNRVFHPSVRWWGTGWAGVCLHPWQFSCWNAGDPNLPKLLSLTTPDPAYEVALACAKLLMPRPPLAYRDVTGGADHYFNPKKADPPWAAGRTPVQRYGDHLFFKLH